MIKTKVVQSVYDKDTGISTVTIQTKEGTFTASSYLHPEDKKIASSFAGCRYAEQKAEIKYLQFHLKRLKQQLKVFTDFYNNLSQSYKFNSNSYEAKQFRKFLYTQQKKYNKLEQYIQTVTQGLQKSINEREKTVKKIIKKKKGRKV